MIFLPDTVVCMKHIIFFKKKAYILPEKVHLAEKVSAL